jgi:4-hydroxybenzoate polyprenyltransferase
MKDWLQLFRVKNILIGVSSAALFYSCLFLPLSRYTDKVAPIDWLTLMIILVDLAIIIAAGNMINDLIDIEADRINRPDRPLVNGKIDLNHALDVLLFLIFAGTILALIAGLNISRPMLAVLFPVGILLLYCYSKYFKSIPLIGNLVIAILCGGIPWLLVVAEYPLIQVLANSSSWIVERLFLVLGFSSYFMFMLTLIREVVKDRMDIAGDQIQGKFTFAALLSTNQLSLFLQLLWVVTFATFLIWIMWAIPYINWVNGVLFLLPLIGCFVFGFLQTSPAKVENLLSDISSLLKWMMVLGLLHLCYTGLFIN